MMPPQRPPLPVSSYFVLSGFEGEQEFNPLGYEKTDTTIKGRFNLPIAKLANLPPHLCQEIFQIKLDEDESEMKLEHYWTEGEISYMGISQLKYVGEVCIIHLSTFLASPAALSLGFQAPESLDLKDGSTVMVQSSRICNRGFTGTNLFPLPEIDLTGDDCVIVQVVQSDEDELPDSRFHPSFHNQIAFKKADYIVSIASDLDLETLQNIVVEHIVIE